MSPWSLRTVNFFDMKKIITIVLMLTTLLSAHSCMEAYDDTYLSDRMDNLEDRVTELETLCQEMNSNIASLQTLINATQQGDYITDLSVIYENGVEIGYSVTFAKNGTIKIYHGKDGTDGKDGVDGAPGKDGEDGKDGADGAPGKDGEDGVDVGHTPDIGIKQDTDGVYYWTLNGEWLLDDDGNKIKAVGVDGTNGNDGVDGDKGDKGDQGDKGDKGDKGDTGNDGVTPQLRINNEYWEVSYDGGKTWTSLDCKATGEDGISSADAIFDDVYEENGYVVFELKKGGSYKVPLSKESGLAIEFSVEQGVAVVPQTTLKIGYTVTGAKGDVLVRNPCVAQGFEVVIKPIDNCSGDIYLFFYFDDEDLDEDSPFEDSEDLTYGDAYNSGLSVLISVSDGSGNSILKSLNFVAGKMDSVTDAYMAPATEGNVQATITTNVDDYEVVLPDASKTWLSYAPTKAVTRTDVLEFNVKANEGDKFRSAIVSLVNNMDQVLESFAIVQASAKADEEMIFADVNVKTAAVEAFDADKDGKLTYREAAAVTDLEKMKMPKNAVSFNELEYFAGIGYIPAGFFEDCKVLDSVTLPDQLESIGQYAFRNCLSLKTITLPVSFKAFGTGLMIDSEFRDNGAAVFAGCSALTEIIIPEGVKELSSSLFQGCSSLAKITLPSTLETIGYNVFDGCSSLSAITLPDGLKSIGSGVFRNCSAIKNISIPNVSSYELGEMFMGCSSLQSVKLPDGIEYFSNLMFAGCSSLTAITVPEGVTRIGDSCFKGCLSLSEIILPSTLQKIEDGAFGYGEFYDGYDYVYMGGCSNLTSIDIPSSVTYIGYSAFKGSGLTEIEIPEGLTSIPRDCFSGCSDLAKVVLPEGIEVIGSNAFGVYEIWDEDEYSEYACSSLKNIDFPSTLKSIDSRAFVGSGLVGDKIEDTDVTALFIPESVEWIGEHAFNSCDDLRAVYLESTEPADIEWDVFPRGMTIYVPDDSFDIYKENGMWRDYNIVPYGAMNLNLSLSFSIDDERYYKDSEGERFLLYWMKIKLDGDQDVVNELSEVGFYTQDRDGNLIDKIAMNKNLDSLITGWYWLRDYDHEIDYDSQVACTEDWKIGAYAVTAEGAELRFDVQPVEFVYDHKPSFKFTDATFDGVSVDSLDTDRHISKFTYKYEIDGAFWVKQWQMKATDVENNFNFSDYYYDGNWSNLLTHSWYDAPTNHSVYKEMYTRSNWETIYSLNHMYIYGDATTMSVDIVDGLPSGVSGVFQQSLSVENSSGSTFGFSTGFSDTPKPQHNGNYKRLNVR